MVYRRPARGALGFSTDRREYGQFDRIGKRLDCERTSCPCSWNFFNKRRPTAVWDASALDLRGDHRHVVGTGCSYGSDLKVVNLDTSG